MFITVLRPHVFYYATGKNTKINIFRNVLFHNDNKNDVM